MSRGRGFAGPAAALAACLLAPLAGAQAPEKIESHRDWTAYVLESGGNRICYVASSPLETKPADAERGDTWVTVTHRPAEDVRDEVGVIPGYRYEAGTEVTAIVDSERFTLFTRGEGAWLRTEEEETAMVTAMKKGKRLTVVGRSDAGVTATDEYSLFGFTAAHQAMSKACGLD